MENLLHKEEITGRLKLKIWKKLGIIFLTILIISLGIYLPAKRTYQRAMETKEGGRKAYAALKNQDIAKTRAELKNTREKLLLTQKSLQPLVWVRFIPLLGNYYKDVNHLLKAASYGLDSAEIVVETIEPYSDVLGLKGQGSFVLGSAEERIQKAVQTMDKVTPKFGEIEELLEKIKSEVNAVNPKRYPKNIGKLPVREQIVHFQDLVDETTGLFIEARPLLEIAPRLLGEPEEKRYLILFQNDKELRPTGGFITAYAIFRLKQGKMVVEHSDDIYRLDTARTKRFPAPPEILKYHKNVNYLDLRDSNLSPDFYYSMKKFEELYETVRGKTEIDGIIALDTHVLVEAIKILGPIPAYGINFTVDPDPRCGGCPQVIYELEDYASRPVGYVRESRKDIIGVLLYQIMQKALGVSPGQYWGKLFQMGISEIKEKHILAYFREEEAQKGAEALNFAGRIRQENGGWDYLHINDTNFAGAKSNMFVQESVKQEINISNEGTITKTVIIDYKNPAPPSDCGLESGGLCLNGILRNWLRVYVPKGSELLEFKGSEMKVEKSEEAGKTVFEGFLTVVPLGSSQVIVKYRLPFKKELGKEYKLLLQKQPGTEGHEYTIIVNGKQREKFPLKMDKEIKLKI